MNYGPYIVSRQPLQDSPYLNGLAHKGCRYISPHHMVIDDPVDVQLPFNQYYNNILVKRHRERLQGL